MPVQAHGSRRWTLRLINAVFAVTVSYPKASLRFARSDTAPVVLTRSGVPQPPLPFIRDLDRVLNEAIVRSSALLVIFKHTDVVRISDRSQRPSEANVLMVSRACQADPRQTLLPRLRMSAQFESHTFPRDNHARLLDVSGRSFRG